MTKTCIHDRLGPVSEMIAAAFDAAVMAREESVAGTSGDEYSRVNREFLDRIEPLGLTGWHESCCPKPARAGYETLVIRQIVAETDNDLAFLIGNTSIAFMLGSPSHVRQLKSNSKRNESVDLRQRDLLNRHFSLCR